MKKIYCSNILLVISIITLGVFALQSCESAKANEENEDLLLDLYYGMEYDSLRNTYVDSVLDVIPGIYHHEIDRVWYLSYSDVNNVSFHTRFGIYIDSVIPPIIWKNLQPILNENFAEHISYDVRFDSIYAKEIAQSVGSTTDYIKKWSNLMDKFSEDMKPLKADSVYNEILHLRTCGVVHKIFEDENWETYLVEFTFSYHGGCGCASYADYISFNKHDGHQLTEAEVLAKYDKLTLDSAVDNKLSKEKINRGYDPNGGPNEYTKQLFGASGMAYVKDGILIYYQPYVAGSGAEGQYNLIIPDADLK